MKSTRLSVESEASYSWLDFAGKRELPACSAFKELEAIWGESGFLRIRHPHLLNPAFERKFIRQNGGTIVMEDGTQLSVSRTPKDRFFELFDNIRRL